MKSWLFRKLYYCLGCWFWYRKSFFTGFLYKLNTVKNIKVNRAQYWKHTDLKQDNIEYTGNKYYNLTSGSCFKRCKLEKRRKDCDVFKETNYINEMLDFVLDFKGETKKIKNKTTKCNLYLMAHNGSGFDSYVKSSNLSQ